MTTLKPKKLSLVDFTDKYANNPDACEAFFFNAKYPDGYTCEKCGCTHYRKIKSRNHVYQCCECGHQQYLFAGTIFQDNKLDLYKLLLGLFLFFNANKGISAIELASNLNVNYKTALLLARKCRILMSQSNGDKLLDSMFYESDVTYIGSTSKEPGHQGMGTEKQPFLVVLSTDADNKYPTFLKMKPVKSDTGEEIFKMFNNSVILGKERLLNTDGKTTYNILKNRIKVRNEPVDYDKPTHRLYWLNIIIGNIQNQIIGIYHGLSKRDLPLFVNEQVYRFNHRNSGTTLLDKVSKYITQSTTFTKRMIINGLDKATPIFTN